MRILSLVFLIMVNITLAQPMKLAIDSIKFKDQSEKERLFTINYSLKNNTSDTLYFFLDPKKISPSTGGSMTKEMYYKIYEEGNFIEIGMAFNQVFPEQKLEAIDSTLTQNQRDSVAIVRLSNILNIKASMLMAIYKEEGSAGLLDLSKHYMNNYYRTEKNYYHFLPPNQTEHFEANFVWDKKRYYYMEPNEFYLSENAKHYFELTFVALKEEFKGRVDDDVLEKIIKMPHFIKGVFVSNKIEIDFD